MSTSTLPRALCRLAASLLAACVLIGIALGLSLAAPDYVAPPATAIAPTASPYPIATPGRLPIPIRLEAGPHVLIDDYWIESSQNVTRRVNQPQRFLAGPVVTHGEGFQNYDAGVYVTYDPAYGPHPFRMWYGAYFPAAPTWYKGCTAYVESDDGINWIPPFRCINVDVPDRAPTVNGIIDEGSNYPDPAIRFKASRGVSPQNLARPGVETGMMAAFSPDGLNWTAYNNGQVLIPAVVNDDIWGVYRDPIRNQYGLLMKMLQDYTWTNAEGQTQTQTIRLVGHSTSSDFENWTTPRVLFAPGSQDPGVTQWYSSHAIIQRGDLLIGFLRVLRDDLVAEGVPDTAYGMGWTELIWTRDGENWDRDGDANRFFEPDPELGAWDHALAWIGSALPTGDEVYLYYGGYANGHKGSPVPDRQLGLLRMMRDRYVAWEAGDAEGLLRTPVVILAGEKLSLNVAAAGGVVRTQVLDGLGNPIPGFTYADCQPITTDSLDAPVQCSRFLGEIANMPVRLEFSMRNASLFAFTLE